MSRKNDTVFGLPGMLIAFPLAGSVKIILDRVLQVTAVDQEVLKLPTVPLRIGRPHASSRTSALWGELMSLGVGFLVLLACCTQGKHLPDDGANHWVYEGLSIAKAEGLLVGYPDGLGPSVWTMPRRTLAEAYWSIGVHIAHLKKLTLDLQNQIALDQPGTPQALKDEERGRDIKSALSGAFLSNTLAYFERSAKEFAPEMRSMGHDPLQIPGISADYRHFSKSLVMPQVGSAYRQFSDVPKDHWAAKSLLELRSAGLVHGYPDGKFRG